MKRFYRVEVVRSALVLALLVAMLFSSMPAPAAQAASEHLFAPLFGGGFGPNGDGTLSIPQGRQPYRLRLHPDGSYLLAGIWNGDFWVARYSQQGQLDQSYGDAGEKLISTRDDSDIMAFGDMIVAADGSVLLGGRDNSNFLVARLTPQGQLDKGFDNDGIRIYNRADEDDTYDGTQALALQPDGKIVVAGYTETCGFFSCDTSAWGMLRFQPDGRFDQRFGSTGLTIVQFSKDNSVQERAQALVMQPDGAIVVVGDNGQSQLGVARLTASGTPDPAFRGKGVTSFKEHGPGYRVARQPDGKLIILTRNISAGETRMVRLLDTGELDETFGTAGSTRVQIAAGNAQGADMALLPTGEVLVYAMVPGPAGADLALLRYTSAGRLDSRFGNGSGYRIQHIGPANQGNYATAMALQPDGKVVITASDRERWYLARLLAEGSFDKGGYVEYNRGRGVDTFSAVAVLNDRNIITVGATNSPDGQRIQLLINRRMPNGDPDPSFDGDGVVIDESREFSADGRAVVIDGQGRIVVAGIVNRTASDTDFALWRYMPDGKPDLSLQGSGFAAYDLGTTVEAAYSVLLQSDGKILLAGGGLSGMALLRLNADGSRDQGFGAGDGQAIYNVPGGIIWARDIALQRDGKILAAGFGYLSGRYRALLRRYHADGSDDTSFNTTGGVELVADTNTFGHAVALQPDGRILMAGYSSGQNDGAAFIARYKSDGQPDLRNGNTRTHYQDILIGEQSYLRAFELDLAADGSITMAGCQIDTSGERFTMIRVDSNLMPDPAFDTDGIADFAIGGNRSCAYAMARDRVTGEYLLGGERGNTNIDTFAILVKVRGPNTPDMPPVAGENTYRVRQGETLRVAAPGLLENDRDPEGSLLAVQSVFSTSNGALVLGADGSFNYTPNAGFSGVDQFGYRAWDGVNTSDTALVQIVVEPAAANRLPQAQPDRYTAVSGTTLTVGAPGVLANDSDDDRQPLSVQIATPPANGQVVLAADGSFSYRANPGFSGTDRFSYRASDGIDQSLPAEVTMNVRPGGQNTPPVASDDRQYTTGEGQALTVPASAGVLANDNDADDNRLSAQFKQVLGGQGQIDLKADGSFSFVPAAGFNGEFSFQYTAFDGKEQSGVATVTIRVGTAPAESKRVRVFLPLIRR